MQQKFQLNDGDRVLQQTSFGFDVAIWEVFGTLCSGGRLVIPADKDFDLARTVDTIIREKITVLQLVPSLLRNPFERAGVCELPELASRLLRRRTDAR